MAQSGSKRKTRIDRVNARAELERMGWEYEATSDEEVKLCCPACKERNPSASLNVKKNLWKCHSANCGASGDIVSFIAFATETVRNTVLKDLSRRYDISDKKTINPKVVEQCHEQIWNDSVLRKELSDRGVTDDLIRWARLGVREGRITIPVFDADNRVLNIRRYMPGAPGHEKMRNTPGYGSVELYIPTQLSYPAVWICGGELKALAATPFLNEHGTGATAATSGEGNWNPKLSELFANKRVYICMDVDAAGERAAQKVAAQVVRWAESVKIIRLPLDKEKHPKGDLNDYIAEGATTDDFLKLMNEAEEYYPPDFDTDDEEDATPTSVRLIDTTKPENLGKRLEFTAIVSAMDTTPYILPKRVAVSCTKDQENCPYCPINAKRPDSETGQVYVDLRPTSAALLQMANVDQSKQASAVQEGLGIPPCKVVNFTFLDRYTLYDARLVGQLHVGGDNADHIVSPAMLVGDCRQLDLNSPYKFRGKTHPHPRTQQATILADEMEEAADNLSSFDPADEEVEDLKVFIPDDWSAASIEQKLSDIYDDLEANVTRIFQRRDLHLMVDLAYHSPLQFYFDDTWVRGWTNILITGDSSQGKTETSNSLKEHYGLGERVECKNASVAGLLGGVQEMGKRWFVSWGVIPMHDRQLVILEEIKGTPTDVIGKLTDMRSSGIAEISKIEKRRAHARTRLLMISNPRGDRPIRGYNFGVEAIRELIGGLEDVRRLDAALIVSSDQIDAQTINDLSSKRPSVEHTYTAERCRRLVLWAWTRTIEQIEFENDAINYCVEAANDLCKKYHESLPLIDRGTARYKLARLASAVAARTFSTDGEFSSLIVRRGHVEVVKALLDRTYSDTVFGYSDYSRAQEYASKLLDRDVIREHIRTTKHPKDLVENLLHSNDVQVQDLMDWCDTDKDEAQKMLSFLVRKHALYRSKREYHKSSGFIDLLRRMREEGVPEDADSTIGDF